MPSFVDQVWAEGKENLGGLLGALYFLSISSADTSGVTVAADGVSLTGNVTAAVAQKAIKIYATEDTIRLMDAQQGEVDGESVLNTLTFFMPGSTKESASFKRKVTTSPGIWFVKDSDLNWRVLGLAAIQDPETPGDYVVITDINARVTAKDGTHGGRTDERKGTTLTITQTTPHEALFYSGVIPHDDYAVVV